MKWKMVLGALVLSASLCSQGFGFELLERMLGGGGCNSCCATSCCEPACCEAPACCEPTCCEAAACCEPACCEAPACCEPACCEAPACCDSCGNGCCHKKHCHLFGGLKGLFDHKKCCRSSCCEPACCEAPSCCEPACCEAAACCEPACCEAPACDSCCNSCNSCCKKRCGGLLAHMFAKKCHRRSCNSCGGCDTCGNGCGNGCGAGCHGAAPSPADDEAAPMPPAPMADPSASIMPRRQVVKATSTSTVVRRHYQ